MLWLYIGMVQAQVADLGETTFENSGSEQAQQAFLRGILLLHSFEYPDAREAFVEARKIDPGFAMAYWGEAMTHNQPIWYSQSLQGARGALEALAGDLHGRQAKAPTEREKDYLGAVDALFYGGDDKLSRDIAYMEAMEHIATKYPEDLDAQAFYALSILGTVHHGRDFATYMRAAAVAEEVFAKNPQHPGAAHYLIHSYDDAVHAPLGLRAARVYSRIAPAAAHALHMPSHIFVSMGMWDEVEALNIASFEASDARMKRKGLSVNARSFHARQWLAYSYLQQGRYEEAGQLLDDMVQDVLDGGESSGARYHLAEMRATHVVETREWDSDILNMDVDSDGLRPESVAADHFVTGMAALKQGNEKLARQKVKALMDLKDLKGRDEKAVRIVQHQLKAALLKHEGNHDEALKLVVKAAEMENKLPLAYGPPFPVKPAYEMLGEYYLESGQARKAQEAFQSALARAPKRALSLLGLAMAAEKAGNDDVARAARATLHDIWHQADAEVIEWASSAFHP